MYDSAIKSFSFPPLLGLFGKRLDGDDALLELARQRFAKAGLGAEFYAEKPAELERLLQFEPAPKSPSVAHLGRGIDLFQAGSHDLIMDFAIRFGEQVFGLVIHDQAEIDTRFDDYVAALQILNSKLHRLKGPPRIFIEYAVGLKPDIFVELFKRIHDLDYVGCCIDIGHIGLWQARATYACSRPGKDVCAITPYDPGLPEVIEDVQRAVGSALETVLNAVRDLCAIGKPLHFHLHDAHPLSTFSVCGVSDHLSFMDAVKIPFQYRDECCLDLMFGPSGLSMIVRQALHLINPERLSFTLEIHPKEGRLPLGDYTSLFSHWADKTNAERMNFWLSVMIENHKLLIDAAKQHVGDKGQSTLGYR